MIFNSESNLIKQFILNRKSRTLWIILLGLISNVLTIIIPVSIGRYYQLVFNFEAYRLKSLKIIPNVIWDTVPKFLVIFSILIIVRYLFFFLHQYYLKNEGELFIKQVKDYLFNHQLLIQYDVYKEKGIGKYLLRYSGDINSLKNLFLKGSISAIVDGFMIIISLFWLYMLNSRGAMAIVIMSCLFYLIIRFLNKKVESYSFEKRNKTSGQLSLVSRTLNSILTVILLNKQNVELKKYKKKSKAVLEEGYKYNKWLILNRGFVSFIQYAILCVILYIFYLDIGASEAPELGGSLISFILLYITILPVLRRLFNLETVYKLGNISLNKLNNIIAIENEDINLGKSLVVKNPRIIFEGVTFNSSPDVIDFNSEKMVINTIQLPKSVEPMDIIQVIGRVNEKYRGQIKINGIDIKDYSRRSLRENIAFVSKDLPLIGRTVYEVLTEFRSEKIRDKIEQLFLDVQSSFNSVSKLQLDDSIGENGSKLSTVQYELLCFVRGILTDKKIMIVDVFPYLEAIEPLKVAAVLNQQKATIIVLKK